jgi:hypothetical protein
MIRQLLEIGYYRDRLGSPITGRKSEKQEQDRSCIPAYRFRKQLNILTIFALFQKR